jgi:hypothetical protein
MNEIARGVFKNLVRRIANWISSAAQPMQSRLMLSGLSQHTLPQNAVGPRLIAFSSFFQPRNHVRVEAQRNGLLHRTVEPAPDRIFPRRAWQFRNALCGPLDDRR